MLPASCNLQQGSLQVGVVHSYGGYADVSKGEYFGRDVAVKHLRFGTRDSPDKIFKVVDSPVVLVFAMIHGVDSGFAGKLLSGSASPTPISYL